MDNYKYVTYENAHSSSNFLVIRSAYPSFIDHIMISEDLFNEHDIVECSNNGTGLYYWL